MLIPRRVKHRKQHHPSRKGATKGGSQVAFGDFGIQALAPAYVTNRQIEAARIAMTRSINDLAHFLGQETIAESVENDKIIEPGDPLNSILYFRLHTTLEEYRMPLLGRSLPHDEALLFIEEWILNLNNTCD